MFLPPLSSLKRCKRYFLTPCIYIYIIFTLNYEITGEWGKIYNAELNALYSSSNIIRNLKSRRVVWAGHVAHMEQSRNAYRILVEKLEGTRPLGRLRRRWEDNIKMDLREMDCEAWHWIDLA